MDEKRLTQRTPDGKALCNKSRKCKEDCARCIHFGEILERLEQYEDLEELRTLLKLPCKLGDVVYDLVLCDDGRYRIFEMKVCDVSPFGSIRWIKDKEPLVWNVYLEDDYSKAYRLFYDFGKTVFLTREEAEKALKEMETQHD